MWITAPSAEEQAAKQAEAERIAAQQASQEVQQETATADLNELITAAAGDTIIPPALTERYGAFAYST